MRARILDEEALRAIAPTALTAYARAAGWGKERSYGRHADVYAAAGKPEVIVPRTDQVGDYVAVVSRLLGLFSETSGQDQPAVYRDLIGFDRDVVRVRAKGVGDDGSVALDAGVELFGAARDMLLAAACAVRSPRPTYRVGSNKDASALASRVRLGQTEHGSFVVALEVPVPPVVQPLLDGIPCVVDDDPLERQVTRRLVAALQAAKSAVDKTGLGESGAFSQDAVAHGVSANLCDAVATLADQAAAVEVSVSWARSGPASEGRTSVEFSRADAAVLREAARTFYSVGPRDVVLDGWVHRLTRGQDDKHGRATFSALVDDRPQSVTAELDPDQYSIAVRAHEARMPVEVRGDLERRGKRWWLARARVLELRLDEPWEGSPEA